ncbi:hypothetical protein CASFOL_025449 [Castilleja foliolosa]|uniref:Uncharacterized protein n=1 Tax=Castilleja foliolosa TaxID=1961234 RepID=A0ABD3CR68_9LAMI
MATLHIRKVRDQVHLLLSLPFVVAFERFEGRKIVENKTADFIQDTRKLQIRRKGNNSEGYDQAQNQTSQQDLLRSSRDIKILREAREKGVFPADDDMIRLQLETLLAEKAWLANENSIYARENRFLREIVEYHQLAMQDVVYLDDGIEEVTEVYDPVSRVLSPSASPSRMSRSSSIAKEMMSLLMATVNNTNDGTST